MSDLVLMDKIASGIARDPRFVGTPRFVIDAFVGATICGLVDVMRSNVTVGEIDLTVFFWCDQCEEFVGQNDLSKMDDMGFHVCKVCDDGTEDGELNGRQGVSR